MTQRPNSNKQSRVHQTVSGQNGNEVEATPNDARYECDLCGACCKTWRVMASAEDAAREPRIVREGKKLPPGTATGYWEYQLFKLPFHEGCCFLGPENKCGIYETRPGVCRGFTAGSDRCQEARAAWGLMPLPPTAGTQVTIEGKPPR
jgi:Fe-S-cluster containining protein